MPPEDKSRTRGPSAKDRHIRVFISSTFRDMQAERDYLVKYIFPQLRNLCESRDATWGEVDLRWGVTDEQAAEGKVLSICLEEIKRCRPYFIGLLGERYGWVQQHIPEHLVEDQPWLAPYLDRSVTELEILYGVLRDTQIDGYAFFYFRDPSYLATIAPEKRSDFVAETDQYAEKLKQLKGEIRRARNAQGCNLREGYGDSQELGHWILEDFTRLINDLFPEDQRPDQLDREISAHEAFAESRTRVYIGRQEYFDRLDAHAAGQAEPLVILGDSGSGKSALLANWAARYRAAHPGDYLLMHFVGATPGSAEWAAMLRRIMGELKRHFGITQELPDQHDALRTAFADWLHMSAARGNVVLILDALNMLEDREGALDLVWLPPTFPSNVRVFLSTMPGRSLQDLNRRGWQTFQVRPLDNAERSQLVGHYLAQYTKALDRARVARVVTAPQTSNPLFLRVLLEELRVFGSHERLDERLSYYLEAGTAVELYQKVLARWETDYDGDNRLVRNAMIMLAAARRGLSESELLEMLGAHGLPLASVHWSPFYLAAEQMLVNRAGMMRISHDDLREAVRRTYLLSSEDAQSAHLRLADYFATKSGGNRKIDELPWQLRKAGQVERLFQLLADLDFIASAFPSAAPELGEYWGWVEAAGPRMLDAYKGILENTEPHRAVLNEVASLLRHRGYLKESHALWERLAELERLDGNEPCYAAALGAVASVLLAMGSRDQAADRELEREQICRELRDEAGVAASLGTQAEIAFQEFDFEWALTLVDEQEQICRRLGDGSGLHQCLGLKARCLSGRGHLKRALAVSEQQEKVGREIGSKHALISGLEVRAEILDGRGRTGEARTALEEAEKLCRELGDKGALADCIEQEVRLLRRHGEHLRALALVLELEGLLREIGSRSSGSNPDRLALCLIMEAELLANDKQRLDEALAKCDEAEYFFARAHQKDVGRVLVDQVRLSLRRGVSLNRSEAFQALRWGVVTGSVGVLLGLWNHWLWLLGGPLVAAAVFCFLAALDEFRHLLPGFFVARSEAVGRFIERRVFGRPSRRRVRIGALRSQGWRLYLRGEADEALRRFELMAGAAREARDKDVRAEALAAQGDIREARGDVAGAAAVRREREKLSKRFREEADRRTLAERVEADARREPFESWILAAHGDAFAARGDFEGAAERYSRAALFARRNRELHRAHKLYDKESKALEQALEGFVSEDGIRITMLAGIVLTTGEGLGRVLRPLRRQEELWRTEGQPANTAKALANQALLLARLIARSRHERASVRYPEAQLASVLAAEQRTREDALALARKAESAAAKAGDPALQQSLQTLIKNFEGIR